MPGTPKNVHFFAWQAQLLDPQIYQNAKGFRKVGREQEVRKAQCAYHEGDR
jgi:hypothetical protein